LPNDLTVADGSVFIGDSPNDRVVELAATGSQQTLPFSGLSEPGGVAVDSSGDVIVADHLHNRIVELPAASPPASTSLTHSGPTSGAYGQPVTLSARLTSGGTGVAGEPVTIGFGAESCTATTGSDGTASCQVTPTDKPNGRPYEIAASFAGDAGDVGASR
jgi:hypothetical protein